MENSETKSNEKITEILGLIGLNKNDITIYLELVKSNPLPALEISKRTKIHRSNTYDSLRNLVEKGFIKELIAEGRKEFEAIDPEKIKDYIRQKEQELDLILPELKQISGKQGEKGSISLAQGIFAARQALLEILNLNSTIYVSGASKEAVEGFGTGFLKEFHKQRIKQKIQMYHIYNKDAIDRIKLLNKMKYTEAKYLPEKFNTTVLTLICADRVLFFIFSKPLLVIRIDNKEIAEVYRKYTELMLKSAKI